MQCQVEKGEKATKKRVNPTKAVMNLKLSSPVQLYQEDMSKGCLAKFPKLSYIEQVIGDPGGVL